MSEKKNFFDMSGAQGMVFGFIAGIALVSVVGLVYVLAGGSFGGGIKTAKTTTLANTSTTAAPTPTAPAPQASGDFSRVPPVGNQDYIRGDQNAKITLIEYSDFQCPFCQRHLPTLNKILQDYDGQVRLVYRHFPLNSIHPQAQKAAEASECAGEQGKFWEYHDLLFANQSALQVADLKSYAGKLSLKQSQFDQCLDSGKYANKVNQQAQDAQTSGITGTPGTWVNNQLVKGAYPYETFKQIIDALLK